MKKYLFIEKDKYKKRKLRRYSSLSVLCFMLSCNEGIISSGLSQMHEMQSSVSKPELRKTLPASWDESWFSSPAIYDLDNDGRNEIIASRHSVLYVWSFEGQLLWRAPVGENSSTSNDHGNYRMYCSAVAGDLDNDQYGEIAVSYSNKVAVYDHLGNIQAGWPQAFPGSDGELRSLAASDLDGDGSYELVTVKTSSGPVSCVWHIDGRVASGWPQVQNREGRNDYGGYNQNVGISDLDGDGLQDLVFTYDICHIGIMKADGSEWHADNMFNREYVSAVPMFHDMELARQGWGGDGNDRDEFTDSPPVFADMDNDGLSEIILFSDYEKAGEYVNRGNSLWVLNPDMTRVPGFEKPFTTSMPLFTGYIDNIVQVAPSPCISSLDQERPHVIVPSYDGNLYCFSPNGGIRWKLQFGTGNSIFIGCSEAAAGDLDNDGICEIVFCTYSIDKNQSYLVILNCNGQLLHRVSIDGRGSMAAPSLADIDGDGIVEIVISCKDAVGKGLGGVQIWDVLSAKINRIDWPTARGGYLRTGELRNNM